MRPRYPLFAKIVAWFFLNLAVLAVVGWLVVEEQLRFGLESLLAGRAGDRIRSVADHIVQELNDSPPSEWTVVLANWERAYPVELQLVSPGARLAGATIDLPPEVRERLARAGGPRPEPRGGGPRHDRPGPPPWGDSREPRPEDAIPPPRPNDAPPGARSRTASIIGALRAGEPRRYWVLLRAPLAPPNREGATVLVLSSKTLSAGGLIFDFTPVLWGGAGVLVFSALFWLPLIRGITRSISRIEEATARISEGQFDVQLSERRRDELGSLSVAINRMSARLAGLLSGQRRFLSDVAHELCAPLSRLQMALGILEETAAPAESERLRDLREEVDQIAELVNQLLSFSRAAIGSTQVELRDLPVREALEQAVHREIGEAARVEIECDAALGARADPDLLQRALGNLLRNALHHGASTGLIAATAHADGEEVLITIEDQGPGVPEEALPRLFDPFFRIDSSRTRETGGVGLGLTIARTCLDACGGHISARNRPSGGLEVRVRLPIAQAGREVTTQSYRARPLASRQ